MSFKLALVLITAAVSSIGQASTATIGYWVDPATRLMWAGRDNGKDVNWKRAVRYCRNLRLGGYSDWRLAELSELQGIYDPALRTPGTAGKGREMTWHVKGDLFLTGNQWSSSKLLNASGRPSGYAWRFDFNEGRAFDGDEIWFTTNKRALCVRQAK